jgi:glycosyltransferase involved in cell wall biosynthesis
MRKVIIVSYYFPPNTTIVSSFRPYSWYCEFEKHDLLPVIVTRHWTDKPITSSEEAIAEDLREKLVVVEGKRKIIYLPYHNTVLQKGATKKTTSAISRMATKLYELAGLFSGNFTNEPNLYAAFKNELPGIIREEKPDLVIFSALPVSLIRLAHDVKKTFRIPVVVDFKDFWNNNLLNDNYRFTKQAKFYFFVQERFIRRWLQNIDMIMSVSQPILDKVSAHTKAAPFLLHNGYERNLFRDITEKEDSQTFSIVLTGMLYPLQDRSLLINGFNRFLAVNKFPGDVKLFFIGLAYVTDIADDVRKSIPEKNLFISNRLPRKEALCYMKRASVLLYAGWKGWRGIYSGKIFEYLGAQRNILLAPGDDDVLDALLQETKAGKIANTEEEMATILQAWYDEWKKSGKLQYNGELSIIENYTREALAEKFAKKLKEFFSVVRKDQRI